MMVRGRPWMAAPFPLDALAHSGLHAFRPSWARQIPWVAPRANLRFSGPHAGPERLGLSIPNWPIQVKALRVLPKGKVFSSGKLAFSGENHY